MAERKRRITESYCINHGRFLPIDDFYKSNNPMHENGVLPFCKNCMNKIFQRHLKNYNTLEAACYFTCAEVGVPFIKQVYDNFAIQIKKYESTTNYFGVYYAGFQQKLSAANREKWTDFGATNIDFKDIASVHAMEQNVENAERALRMLWGDELSLDDLQYLEDRYAVYTEDKYLEPLQEQMYRNLCRAELDIHKNIDIDKAIQRQRTIAKDLGLDQFDKQQRQTEVERMIEYDIMLMEKEEPAEYYKEQEMYKDFRGINAGYIKEILRPVLNLITGSKEYKIDGEDAEKYMERVSKEYGES